jgi:hypothetical protein
MVNSRKTANRTRLLVVVFIALPVIRIVLHALASRYFIEYANIVGWAVTVIYVVWIGLLIFMQARQIDALIAHDFRVCPKCTYMLRELDDAGNCPECGRPFDDENLRSAWRRGFFGCYR